jgi:gluconokinase
MFPRQGKSYIARRKTKQHDDVLSLGSTSDYKYGFSSDEKSMISGLIVMGVSGCGKTTVGKALAGRLGWDFFDADDFHPSQNKAKMAAGIPLNDADRAPWLAALHTLLSDALRHGRHPVLACSALKEAYRNTLLDGNPGLRILYLQGNSEQIYSRIAARTGHYMKPDMLQSQFESLEPPRNALIVDISPPVDAIVDAICRILHSEGVA